MKHIHTNYVVCTRLWWLQLEKAEFQLKHLKSAIFFYQFCEICTIVGLTERKSSTDEMLPLTHHRETDTTQY